jgi:very-short-patch-repair endonuclease
MTYPEQLIFDLLTNSNIAFEHQKKVNKYYPDFTIGNIIIEVDGDWFHRDKEKEEKRDVILIAEGYEVHHFKVGSKKDLVKRVTEFLISKTLL